MQLNQLTQLLSKVKGCTFASLDAETEVTPGVRRIVTNEAVILFTNKRSSGYEAMVKRRLAEIGKEPECFEVKDLPWGSRIPDTPLIVHHGKYYLQTIVLREGEERMFVGNVELAPEEFSAFTRKSNVGEYQCGLGDRAVIVRTYKLESLKELRLMGETVACPMRGT